MEIPGTPFCNQAKTEYVKKRKRCSETDFTVKSFLIGMGTAHLIPIVQWSNHITLAGKNTFQEHFANHLQEKASFSLAPQLFKFVLLFCPNRTNHFFRPLVLHASRVDGKVSGAPTLSHWYGIFIWSRSNVHICHIYNHNYHIIKESRQIIEKPNKYQLRLGGKYHISVTTRLSCCVRDFFRGLTLTIMNFSFTKIESDTLSQLL